MKKLQDQQDDYMLLERTKTHDHSHSRFTVQRKKQNRIAFTGRDSKLSQNSKHFIKSKENSILSVTSSVSSSKTSQSSLKFSKKSEAQSHTRQKLSRKIEELKAKASLEEKEKQ